MKIAIPYENGQVFQHFGHSAQFKLYTAEEGRITGAEVVSTDGQGHGALVGFLVRNGVNVLLCGGIGGGASHARSPGTRSRNRNCWLRMPAAALRPGGIRHADAA